MSLTKRMQTIIAEKKGNHELSLQECVRRAGYSARRVPQQTWELQKNGEFMAAWEATAKPELPAERKLSPEEVVKDLDDIADICTKAGAGSWQVSARLKAVELKAKILGMLSESAARTLIQNQVAASEVRNIVITNAL